MLRAAPPAHACAAAGEAAGGRAVASARRGGAGQAGGGAPAAGFSGPPPACTAPGPPGPGALLPASRRRHLPGPLRPSPPPFEFLPDPARSGSPVSAAGPHPGSELEKVGVERWGRPRGEVRRARGDWWRTKELRVHSSSNSGCLRPLTHQLSLCECPIGDPLMSEGRKLHPQIMLTPLFCEHASYEEP
nr:uncharacterized protein LOC111771102 isoform X2 [Equus caballus]